MDEYRQEHLTFHRKRATLFLVAAGALKKYAMWDSLDGSIPPSVIKLIQALYVEARAEGQIARWWKNMPDEQLERQMHFWEVKT